MYHFSQHSFLFCAIPEYIVFKNHKKIRESAMMVAVDGKKLDCMWTLAKYVYGLVPVLIGLDKFFFFIVDWNIYVSPFVMSYFPIMYFVPAVGVIEIFAGLLILTKWPRFGAYLVGAWIGLVIVNLFMIGDMYDIILRDVAIAFGYIMFGLLTELKETSRQV
jgi:hypothetical protein